MDGVKAYFKKCAHSFAAGTLVLMADGSSKPIEKVKPGERVLATDPVAGEVRAQIVVATHVNVDAELTDVSVQAAGVDTVVQTTAHHPFWSQQRSTWVNAGELRVGERLQTPGGGSLAVSTVASYTSSRVMYDLTIDTTHTYYVIAGTPRFLYTTVMTSTGVCGPTIPIMKMPLGETRFRLDGARVGKS